MVLLLGWKMSIERPFPSIKERERENSVRDGTNRDEERTNERMIELQYYTVLNYVVLVLVLIFFPTTACCRNKTHPFGNRNSIRCDAIQSNPITQRVRVVSEFSTRNWGETQANTNNLNSDVPNNHGGMECRWNCQSKHIFTQETATDRRQQC